MKAHPIGRAITALREKKGWTLTHLAERAGIGKGLLSKLESHPNPNPCYNTLAAVANALNLETSSFFRIIREHEK